MAGGASDDRQMQLQQPTLTLNQWLVLPPALVIGSGLAIWLCVVARKGSGRQDPRKAVHLPPVSTAGTVFWQNHTLRQIDQARSDLAAIESDLNSSLGSSLGCGRGGDLTRSARHDLRIKRPT